MPADPVIPLAAPPRHRNGITLIEVLIVLAIIVILIALLLPATRSARPAARRTQCKNNLKQIALALHNYHDTYGALPPASTVDAAGKPLHSWRTLILPFIEQQALYNKIDLSKSWDDPANAEARRAVIHTYRCPSVEGESGHTTYHAVVGEDACFRPTQPRPFSEITDDKGGTLMVVEVDAPHAVHWMAPTDAAAPWFLAFKPEDDLSHQGGTQAAFVDGSVRFLSAAMTPATRRALISAAGGDDDRLGDF